MHSFSVRLRTWLGTARVTVLLIAAAVAACSTFTMERPRVFIEDIQPIGGGLLSQRFNVLLRLQNPNDHSLYVRGLNFDLDLNGAPFASGVSNEYLMIPRLGSGTMLVEVSTSTLDLIVQAFRLSKRPTFDYTLHGEVLTDDSLTGSLPFENGGQISFSRPVS
jgi:LEA14-like dessication related protein